MSPKHLKELNNHNNIKLPVNQYKLLGLLFAPYGQLTWNNPYSEAFRKVLPIYSPEFPV